MFAHGCIPMLRAHEGFVRIRCMPRCAGRMTSGHANSRPCVACRLEWPVENRPPLPVKLARRLAMTELGER